MMRRRAILVLLALALSACGSGDSGGFESSNGVPLPAPTSETTEPDGDVLPDIDVIDFASGQTVSLADIEGPAVVNLWATWCAPCRAEIPDFEAVHQTRGDEVRFVGINVGESADRALEFIAEVGASYDQFSDASGDVSVALRVTSMPTTLIIDADGTINEKHFGPLDQDDLNEAIDAALANS